jgi:hypothetical protein
MVSKAFPTGRVRVITDRVTSAVSPYRIGRQVLGLTA